MQYIVFHTPGRINIIRNRTELEGKTSKDILSIFKLNPDMKLYITTPFYSEALPMDAQPLEIEPNIALKTSPSRYGRPDYFLSAKTDDDIISLFIKPIPIIEDQNNISMPFIKSDFNFKTVKNGSDVMSCILSSFEYDPIAPSTDSFNMDDTSDHIFSMFRDKHINFRFQLTDKAIKTIKHRGQIIDEILNTEISYVKCLADLSNYWRNKFSRLKIFSKEELELLFKDIPAMVNTHTLFFKDLSERNQNYASVVGDVFLYFADTFKVSQLFISNYDSLNELIDKKKKTKSNIKFFEHENGGPDFSSYLITPVQRMPRYLLFLRELIKSTPKSHPDSDYLPCALRKIELIINEVDSATKKNEEQNKIRAIQKKLSKSFNLLDTPRTLLIESNVIVFKNNCHFYLFNDIVLLTSIDGDRKSVV